jgi:hypothetical protein
MNEWHLANTPPTSSGRYEVDMGDKTMIAWYDASFGGGWISDKDADECHANFTYPLAWRNIVPVEPAQDYLADEPPISPVVEVGGYNVIRNGTRYNFEGVEYEITGAMIEVVR